MPYDSITDRTDAAALIPEEVTQEIFKSLPQESAVLQISRKLPNMSRGTLRLPVLSSLPQAYFVTGDTGLKKTSELAWEDKYITAEELAVIIPVPNNVLADADYDMWAEIQPLIGQAFGAKIDAAILSGDDAPTSWPSDIVTAATAAGNTVTDGTGADLFDDLLGEGGVNATVEADGYMVNGYLAAVQMKSRLRGLRDANGVPIFMPTIQGGAEYMLDGSPVAFPLNGGLDPTAGLVFAGDWQQLVYSIRQDLTFDMSKEAVINDASGNITLNAYQQDVTLMRVVMRLGWQVPNPVNAQQETAASRYPFGVLLP